jgi:transcriptional regulator with XRE-family HTH domain
MKNNIRIIRQSKKLRLQDVAARMERVPNKHKNAASKTVSSSYIRQIECGLIPASPDTLKRIAKALHVRVELLTQEGLKLELVENS